jgi:hypothetical protein
MTWLREVAAMVLAVGLAFVILEAERRTANRKSE